MIYSFTKRREKVKVTNKGEPILKSWKTKESCGQHEDKGETADEKDDTGGAHHLDIRTNVVTSSF